MDQEILELSEHGRMIEAIQVTRQRYGCSLAEARKFVEELQGRPRAASVPPEPPSARGSATRPSLPT